MHILLIADGRSPIARRWINTLAALDHQITLISSSPCSTSEGVSRMEVIPLALSNFTARSTQASGATPAVAAGGKRKLISTFRGFLLALRYRLGPLSVRLAARRYRRLLAEIQPDLVHALRIPYEGMLASFTPPGIPLAISIWGNDLTLHARQNGWMADMTRRALLRADGLHTDAQRDLRLARQWGFPENRPSLVTPSNGGIDLTLLTGCREPLPAELEARIPAGRPLVINPRGVRAYTCTGTFFQSIPLVAERMPEVLFVCPGMAGETEAERWVERLKLNDHVVLLPGLPQSQLWGLFSRCPVSVSLTTHDGTPNTLLEAMACGSFPIAGDIESLREWLIPGQNGLLVEPQNPAAAAEAIVQALENDALRQKAVEKNLQLIQERAEVNQVRPQVQVFYQWVWGLR
jgi:hypothetical protein